jgi:hypothetical protein
MIVRRIRRGDDEDAIDRAYWAKISPIDRFAFVWVLTKHQLELQGYSGDQLRVLRSVASVRRRRR